MTVRNSSIKNNKLRPSTKTKEKISIDSSKLKKFCSLWSMDIPKAEICKQLNIGHTQYYAYINAAEEIVDDFLLGMVDHGLVLQFRTSLQRVQKRAEKMDQIADKALDQMINAGIENDSKDSWALTSLVLAANAPDKLY
ncbi:MAG: hypothetical protein COY74_09365, partial [Nitrosopumilales archaeon CG_4_10_14_0_8_um_filter_34_8]